MAFLSARALLLLCAAASFALAAPVTLRNDVPRRDTDGDIIAAGDGCISYQPDEQLYYLFGAHYQPCAEPNDDCYSGPPGEQVCSKVGWVPEGTCCGWRNATIAAYSSPDLVTWRKEGLNILPLATANPASPLSSNYGAIFEPCGVWNRKTQFWNLFFLRDGYTLASAVARTAAGPFSVVQWSVSVPGFSRIVDFYFWQNVSGELLMKHNGGGGETAVTLSDDYLSIANSSALFGTELGYTEGGGIFQYGGHTFVMAGYGCCFCTLGSNGFLWRADSPLSDYALLGDFVPRAPNHTSVTHAQQFSITPVYTASGVVPMFIGIRFGQAPDGVKSHDPQYWFPLTFDDSTGVMRNVSWLDSFTLDLASPPPPPPPPSPPAPWYACSFDMPGTCVEVPAGAPGASADAAACEAACVPEYVCSHIAPGTCVPLPPGVVPGAFASCEAACAPAFACSVDAPGTCTSVPSGTPGSAPTLADCEAACVECDLAGAWAGSDRGVVINVAQTPVNATAGAVVISTTPVVWHSNATGFARPGVLTIEGGWCSGRCAAVVGPGASGAACSVIDWGEQGNWTRAP